MNKILRFDFVIVNKSTNAVEQTTSVVANDLHEAANNIQNLITEGQEIRLSGVYENCWLVNKNLEIWYNWIVID